MIRIDKSVSLLPPLLREEQLLVSCGCAYGLRMGECFLETTWHGCGDSVWEEFEKQETPFSPITRNAKGICMNQAAYRLPTRVFPCHPTRTIVDPNEVFPPGPGMPLFLPAQRRRHPPCLGGRVGQAPVSWMKTRDLPAPRPISPGVIPLERVAVIPEPDFRTPTGAHSPPDHSNSSRPHGPA